VDVYASLDAPYGADFVLHAIDASQDHAAILYQLTIFTLPAAWDVDGHQLPQRVDFHAWLESLPEHTRRMAETLATGETTSHVARMFGCSASRISQLRSELYRAWRVFQGEVAAVTSSALA
jgi:hypothetical protein